MKAHTVYLLHGSKVFIPVTIGHKWVTGLTFEADGLHTTKVPVTAAVRPALYKGCEYPARKMRGHLRKVKPATKAAAKLRKEVLA